MSDDILNGALDRFKQSQDASSLNRQDGLADVEFARLGWQWPDSIKKQRMDEGRPCLVINRLPSFIRQVVNDARQNSPSITVVPVDSGADPDTAEIIGGLIRSIERGSNAAVAYDTALEHAVDRGFGFFRITTDYAHAESFDMEARIERVANPFSVHWDTNSTMFDASDWEYAFVSDLLTEAEFKRKYPKGKPVSFESGRGDDVSDWIDGNKVRVAEYWLRSEITRKIVQFSDGRVMRADQMEEVIEVAPGMKVRLIDALQQSGVTVSRERDATAHEVKRRIISGSEILEESDWAGSTIPICPVWGEEVIHQGRRHFRSLVRDARDPQQMFNFWRSASTELVALAPKAPWLIEDGAIPRGAEQKWATANSRNHAYLPYAKGSAMPKREEFAGVPAGALQEALNAADDMKAIMGIYDASLGARSNETSGKAIMARQREGDVSTFHFIDNLSRAIQYAGRVLVEIIPSLYSQRQAIQILGTDDTAKVVQLTKESGDPKGRLYNLDTGKYDVAVKTGPSYTTQREAAREALIEIARARPETAAILGDIIIGTMDFPQADIAAKRLKALLPPQVAQAEAEEGGEGAIPPQVQAQMQQMQAQMQQMGQALQQAQGEAANKQGDMQIKAAELQIKREELALKGRELELRAQEAQMSAQTEMARIQMEARQPTRLHSIEGQ